jgi:hypothetical protein
VLIEIVIDLQEIEVKERDLRNKKMAAEKGKIVTVIKTC